MYSLNLMIPTKKNNLNVNNIICQDFDKYYFYYYKDLLNYFEPLIHKQINNIPSSAYKQFKSFDDFLNTIIEQEKLLHLTSKIALNDLPKDYIESIETDFGNESLILQLAYIIHPIKTDEEINIFISNIQSLVQKYNIYEILSIRCCYDCIIQYLHNIYDKHITE